MKMKAILVDLDGTLCDISHREHLPKENNWKGFYAGIPKDKLNPAIKEIINRFQRDYEIILVSGREGTPKVIMDTLRWLKKHRIVYGHIFFRQEKDYRSDNEIKQEIYYKRIKGKYDVFFVLDDRNQVVKMWRALGLRCLQVKDGNY